MHTLSIFKLLLPVILPSWRFFDVIAPSPRVEYTLLEDLEAQPHEWQEFRARPEHLSIGDMMKRLFWNAQWNESLFVMSCAERLMQNPTKHSEDEIFRRIQDEVEHHAIDTPYLQFRLVFISREEGELKRYITYTSPVQSISREPANGF